MMKVFTTTDENGSRVQVNDQPDEGWSFLFNITNEGLIIDIVDEDGEVRGTMSATFVELCDLVGAQLDDRQQCPSCGILIKNDVTIYDHGVCIDCHKQMLMGERCRICYARGHSAYGCHIVVEDKRKD